MGRWAANSVNEQRQFGKENFSSDVIEKRSKREPEVLQACA
jgi:hypothetical protein